MKKNLSNKSSNIKIQESDSEDSRKDRKSWYKRKNPESEKSWF